jgi:hemerythrin superfamily protein
MAAMPDSALHGRGPERSGASPDDIRERLREDHARTLADADRLRVEQDADRSVFLLRQLRRSWVIHALAEETVIYRALEGVEGRAEPHSDERFVEHELVEGLFEKLGRLRPGTHEWRARLNVARDLVARHIESEHNDLFTRLERRFAAEELAEMGRRFELAREKLTLLEQAKAA